MQPSTLENANSCIYLVWAGHKALLRQATQNTLDLDAFYECLKRSQIETILSTAFYATSYAGPKAAQTTHIRSNECI